MSLYRISFRHWDDYVVSVEASSKTEAIATVAASPDDYVAKARHISDGTDHWRAVRIDGGAL